MSLSKRTRLSSSFEKKCRTNNGGFSAAFEKSASKLRLESRFGKASKLRSIRHEDSRLCVSEEEKSNEVGTFGIVSIKQTSLGRPIFPGKFSYEFDNIKRNPAYPSDVERFL